MGRGECFLGIKGDPLLSADSLPKASPALLKLGTILLLLFLSSHYLADFFPVSFSESPTDPDVDTLWRLCMPIITWRLWGRNRL